MILAKDIKDKEYDSYFHTYVKLTKGDLIQSLKTDLDTLIALIREIPEGKRTFAYEKGKWSILQLIQHCVDTERVLQYRAFSIARGEKQMLNSFNENEYVDATPTESIQFKSLLNEFICLRNSTISMFENMPLDVTCKIGQAGGSQLSVRAAGFIILGHWNHHMNVLKTRYLV